jgi:CubicO group peptidase (beta-lactamase class C family)
MLIFPFRKKGSKMNLTTLPKTVSSNPFVNAVFQKIETEVYLNKCTAWSVKLPQLRMSCYFSDEWSPFRKSRHLNFENIHPNFDLASLTKPLFLPMLIKLGLSPIAESLLNLPLKNLLSSLDFNNTSSMQILQQAEPNFTLLDLLNHTAGLKAWHWMGRSAWCFKKSSHHIDTTTANSNPVSQAHLLGHSLESHATRRATLTGLCLEGRNEQSSTSPAVYSDLGYCVLAAIIENSAHFKGWDPILKNLNNCLNTQFLHASISKRYGNAPIPFFPYVSFESDQKHVFNQNQNDFGGVHDTNANVLAALPTPIVSGHAGFIGSVIDVEKTFSALTQNHHKLCLSPEKLGRFQGGLDTPDSGESSSGVPNLDFAKDKNIVGHLGYTGTSFWISQSDPNLHSVLLTNRTAQRTALGKFSPRILVIEELRGSEVLRTLQSLDINGQATSLTLEDAAEICHEETEDRSIIWNSAHIRSLPNLIELRRAVHGLTWQTPQENF